MTDSTFLTEQFIPSRLPDIYSNRVSLMKKFELASKEKKTIFVTAPAGFGKTISTLLWLKKTNKKNIWISLDEYDNSPFIFYKLICNGLLSTQPENESLIKILKSTTFVESPIQHMISFLSSLVPNEENYSIVFDDMHFIDHVEIRKSLYFIFKRLPKTFSVIILSRNTLNKEYKNYVLEGRAFLISSTDLAFSTEEIQESYQLSGHVITKPQAKKAREITGGWPIAVNALMLSGQVEFSNVKSNVLEKYIKDQIWDVWDEELREFMLKTCVLDDMQEEICNILTNRNDSLQILNKLSSSNVFVSKIDDNTYRYHRLFLEFLRDILEKDSNFEIKQLYKVCSDYFTEKENEIASLRYWLKSECFDTVNPYFNKLMFTQLNCSISAALDFGKLIISEDYPPSAYESFPILFAPKVWKAYIAGDSQNMEYNFDKLYSRIMEIKETSPEYLEFVALMYSLDHRISFLSQVKQYIKYKDFIPTSNSILKSTYLTFITHNLPFLHKSNRDYCELSLDDKYLDMAGETFGKSLGVEWDFIKSGVSAGFLYEKYKLKEAHDMSLKSLEKITEECVRPASVFSVYTIVASILVTWGKIEEGNLWIEKIRTYIKKTDSAYLVPNFTAFETTIKLMLGDVHAAENWIENHLFMETESLELYKIYQHFTTARAYMVLCEKEKAMSHILKLVQLCKNFKRPTDASEALTILSILHWEKHEQDKSLEILEQALIEMQPYRFIRIFAKEGESILPLLKKICLKLKNEDYNGALDPIFLNEVLIATYEQAKIFKGVGINLRLKKIKLSKQQKNILSLLAKGHKNSEIVEITGLTINTVKSHTAAAYLKLDVNNYMDAVLKARELGLID